MGKSSFLQDFKAFAMRGNVIDMAVGVIIGGAFGKIVSSIVGRCHHASHRIAGRWRELYRFETTIKAGRSSGWS